MSLSIIKYPEADVNGNSQFVSKWSAVHHEMLFQMQRRDHSVTFDVNPDNGDQMRLITFLPPGVASVVFPGEVIYFQSNNGDSGTFTVISTGANGIFYVAKREGFNPAGSGFINKIQVRENYFVKTNIYVVDESNTYVLVGQSINKPSASGLVNVDVSSFLKSKVGYVNGFDYSKLNDKDLSLGGAYNITYSENWKGLEGVFSGLSNLNLRFFVNAAKQVQDKYGANMGEYVPFYFETPSDAYPESKFLSDFKKPTYFPGFPFSLGFLYSEYLVGITTYKGEQEFDINGAATTVADLQGLENTASQNVGRLTLSGSYPTVSKTLKVWLETTGEEDCVKLVTPGYVQVGFTEEICGLPNVNEPFEEL